MEYTRFPVDKEINKELKKYRKEIKKNLFKVSGYTGCRK